MSVHPVNPSGLRFTAWLDIAGINDLPGRWHDSYGPVSPCEAWDSWKAGDDPALWPVKRLCKDDKATTS